MSHEVHTMQALRFSEFGEPRVVLYVVPTPRPAHGPDEVLVRVEAASVNPSDVKNVQGAMRSHTTLPRTPGRDFAGIVAEGPADLVGKAVWGTGGDLGFHRDGSHAEFLTLPLSAVALRPDNLSAHEAAAVGVGFVTAWTGLMEHAALRPGESVLVIGGGAVGSAVAQIARWQGADQILMTTRSAADIKPGASVSVVDTWIDLSRDDLHEQVKRATNGKCVSIVYSTVGGSPFFGAGLQAMAVGGRMVVISAPIADPKVSLNVLEFYRQELSLFGVNTLHQTATQSARRLNDMAPGFASGALTRPEVETCTLHEAAAAYEAVKAGSKRKVVLTF